MARGRYGDGAVYQMADGTWRGCVELGRDPVSGKRLRKYVRGRTKGEANRKIRELRDQVRGGEVTARTRQQLTVAEWLDQWLSGLAKLRLGEDMQRRYAQIVRDHINRTPGRVPLNKLSPEQVEQLYAQLAAKGLSQRSVVFVHRLLGRAVKVANQRGYVTRNVVRLVELETPHGRSGVALKPEEARAVLQASLGQRDHARWLIALCLGARQSETLGMSWQDLDLEARMRPPGTLRPAAAPLPPTHRRRPLPQGAHEDRRRRAGRPPAAVRRHRSLGAPPRAAAGTGPRR